MEKLFRILLLALYVVFFNSIPSFSAETKRDREIPLDSEKKLKRAKQVDPFTELPLIPEERFIPFHIFCPSSSRNSIGYYYPVRHRLEILERCVLSEGYIKHIGSLIFLNELVMPGKGLTDKDTLLLAKLSGLKEFRSYFGKITALGAKRIADAMTRLEKLDLNCHNLGDAGVAEICKIKSLVELDVGACDLSGHCVNSLTQLSNLRSLVLDRSNLGPADMNRLCKGLPRLRVLDVSVNDIRDEGVSYIANNLTELEVLALDSNKLTGDASQYLKRIISLRKLNIGEEAPINEWLKKEFGETSCEIIWHNWINLSGPQIPDEFPNITGRTVWTVTETRKLPPMTQIMLMKN